MVDRRRKWRAQNQDIWIKESLRGSRFVVNGNREIDYVVDVSKPSCECPDWQKEAPKGGCKHILHVKLENGELDPLPTANTNFGYSKRRLAKGRDKNDRGDRYSPKWNTLSIRTRKRDDWRCQNCGAKGGADGDARVEAHHIVPKSKGGTDNLNNLITLCHSCHESEHGHSIPSGGAPNSQFGISSESDGKSALSTGDVGSTSKASTGPDTRNNSRDFSSPNSKSNSETSRTDDSLSQSLETTYSTIDRDSPLLPPIPTDVKESHYNVRGSKIAAFIAGFIVSAIIGALIQMAVGFQVENVVTLLGTGTIYYFSARSVNATKEKMQKIEEGNTKLEPALERINERIADGETIPEEELNQIERQIKEIYSTLDDDVTQYLKDGYVAWIEESREEATRW